MSKFGFSMIRISTFEVRMIDDPNFDIRKQKDSPVSFFKLEKSKTNQKCKLLQIGLVSTTLSLTVRLRDYKDPKQVISWISLEIAVF